MTGPEVMVHSDADDVAEALAGGLMARLAEIQRDFRVPQVALTGGRIATKAYQRLADEARTRPWTGLGSSSGGATSVSCPRPMTSAMPNRPWICWPSRFI